MKWRRISGLLLISVLLPILKVSAEGTENSFRLSLKEPAEGMEYALYEDQACQKPLKNENGEDIILTTDENGNAETVTSQADFYVKHIHTVPGWYLEKDPIAVSKSSLEIQPHPVSYVFSETENSQAVSSHLQILNEKDEVIADWKTDGPSQPLLKKEKVLLEAGKSYTLRDPDISQWKKTEDVRFEIPGYYSSDQKEEVEIVKRSYGKLTLKTSDASRYPVTDFSIKLYEDEQGTRQATDINGKKEVLHADEKGLIRADLYPGTYYARTEELDSSFYPEDSLYPCVVREKENTETQISFKPVLVNIDMKGSDGKKINGTMVLSGGGEKKNVSPSVLHLKRNTDYVLQDLSHPAGYHAGKDLSFHTPEKENGQPEAVMILPAFEVSGRIRDKETGETVRNSLFQIRDLSGKEVIRFSSGELHTSALHDEAVYIVHCLSMPKGYMKPEDQKLEVGLTGNVKFEVPCISYVTFSMKAVSETDQKAIADVKWSLFEDPECTRLLKDIHGREIRDFKESAAVHNGTFYGRIMTDDPRYYPDSDIYEIHANHAEKADTVFSTSLTRADAEIHVQDQNRKNMKGVKINVLNENGNVIGSYTSDGKDRLTSVKLQEDLLPGSVIYLEIREAPGLYTWKEKRIRIMIPETKPEEIPSVYLSLNPYVSLEVNEADEGGKTSGSTYALYEDENCDSPATDIRGKKAEGTTDREGRIEWNLRPGTYWLKETGTTASAYLNEVPVKVVLNPEKAWYEKQNFATVRPVIHFSTVDTQGNAVSGGNYEIRDENGETVHSFRAGGMIALQGKWLKPGKTIVIHEKEPASGYQKHETDIRYTLPEGIPDKTPEIRIHCLRNTYSAGRSVGKAENKAVKEENHLFDSWIPVVLIGVFAGIVLLKIFSKKNEKRFKNV